MERRQETCNFLYFGCTCLLSCIARFGRILQLIHIFLERSLWQVGVEDLPRMKALVRERMDDRI